MLELSCSVKRWTQRIAWSLVTAVGLVQHQVAAAQVIPTNMRSINAAEGPAALGGYSQAVELRNPRRLLYISGQIPVDIEGRTPPDFAAQCRLVWTNIAAQLHAANMTLENLVKGHDVSLRSAPRRGELPDPA